MRQVRERGLEGIEAVIQRQKGVAAKGNDDGLVLRREDRGAGRFGAHRGVGSEVSAPPLLHRRRADTVAGRKGLYARLTSLDCATDCLCRRGAAVKNLSYGTVGIFVCCRS
jgi:hypothetical protein